MKPVLFTKDLQQTIKFYKKLGFKLKDQDPDWIWGCLTNNNIDILLAYPNNDNFKKSNFTGTFYFFVEDIDTLWNSIKETCEVVYDLEIFDWGIKEFAIQDNNGYMLQFGEEIV